MSRERGQRRRAVGVVTGDSMDKTIVVEAARSTAHPRYGKLVRKSTQYRAHDEKNEAREGDRVELVESRRTSKTKAWRLARVIEAAPPPEASGDS